ncbi:MAG TPA: leucyl aminopeptidase [Candidatus Thermoplasmatota archaeon]|nr:leucyl aminopeptidase [Candidatus Thermoplasmatota archaeon]
MDAPPTVSVVSGDITKAKADAIVVNLFQGVKKPSGAAAAVDAALGGIIADLLKLGDFQGKRKEAMVLTTNGKLASPRAILIGLGNPKGFDLDAVREVAARAATVARDRGCKVLATIVHGAGAAGLDPVAAAYANVEGALLGLYKYQEYKSRPKEDDESDKALTELRLVEADPAKARRMAKAAKDAERVARVTNDVRTLVNRPSMDKPPEVMASTAVAWAKKYGFRARVLEKPDLQRLKMGGILGVGAGSIHAPRLVVLEKPGRRKGKKVLLVGKGITFDSGGISIKPAQGMDQMRHDMAGAAAVLGAMSLAAAEGLDVHVVALMPLAENMPSGSAIRPGDVLRSFDGTTIEVANTDAEGRLVLADAMGYGIQEFDPDVVVDIATLTGAVKVALGTIMTGVFANDDSLAKRLIEAGSRVGDDVWQLPYSKEYESHVKSDVADLRNTGVNWGGSVTAAAFLGHFAKKKKWAHLDIAGTCWTERSTGDLKQEWHAKGATGVGVRLLAEYLRRVK